MIPLSIEERKQQLDPATRWYACGEVFTLNNYKVHDYDRLTGQYRGLAHNLSNLALKSPAILPVIFHNLSGYDSHLLIKELVNDQYDIHVKPHNTEEHISFSTKVISKFGNTFIDSFPFMSCHIDSLERNLKPEHFVNLSTFSILKNSHS
ncbi:hypothetical protein AVEN_153203-1 [Araneus ventricosus]|uniref:DNA-directed DNA polymerase n=1 Tax=Araneus ventricosus TaxID=182803 RepID=A0A4Y2WIM2_ARAVE|nr:hypothetical protein AVEN_153203-1 [Araneus ventricosus]